MVKHRDYSKLVAELSEEYTRRSPQSAALNERALRVMVDGGSHSMRLIKPFPPRLKTAHGAYFTDEDGHTLLDFWQGHFANILGHNPEVVTSALARLFERGHGLQTGFTDGLQVELAELLCRQTGAERVRFTTSGALATMYATMLARAYTGRNLVLKVGGGWHGAQPWGLTGVNFSEKSANPWQLESQGLPASAPDEVLVTRFNDSQMLSDNFRQHGDRIACFIVEPFIGAGGHLFADPEYLRSARALSERYGAALIFDEVISGFRFRAGDLGRMYGVQPDLTVYAKVIGGGMPVAAIAGRAAVMDMCAKAGGRTRVSGGTYAAHPASLFAARTMLEYLVAHEAEVYPRLARLGDLLRRTTESVFAGAGIPVRCTGKPNAIVPGSSMAMVHFVYDPAQSLASPNDVDDPRLCDVALRERVFQLALLCEDVHVVHGLGAVSTAHTEDDLKAFAVVLQRVAQRIKPYLT